MSGVMAVRKRAFIAGVAGQDGSYLVELLLLKGDESTLFFSSVSQS